MVLSQASSGRIARGIVARVFKKVRNTADGKWGLALFDGFRFEFQPLDPSHAAISAFPRVPVANLKAVLASMCSSPQARA